MKKGLGWLLPFLKIGSIGFGGGTALIPVIEQEMVDKRKVVTKEEYDSAVIIASITPGALPVEISGGIGKTISRKKSKGKEFSLRHIFSGFSGMALAAICMALPGVLMSLVLLISMDQVPPEVTKQINILSIGITAFILSMLTKYITGTFEWAQKRKRTWVAAIIVIGVFLLNSGGKIADVLSYFNLKLDFYFKIQTIDILIITFFVICYVGSKLKASRVVVAGMIGILFILLKDSHSRALIGNETFCTYGLWVLQIAMLIMSVLAVVMAREKQGRLQRVPIRVLLLEEVGWFAFLIAASIPALFLVKDFLSFIGSGYVSSIASFGGGDAYLTIADGFFVETGMITNEQYSNLVIAVNVLPGSILCKTLTGVGYYLGYSQSGFVWVGLAAALSGFVCSVVGSCSVISLVQYFFQTFDKLRVFQVLKAWVKTVISGLLGGVILKLIILCLDIAKDNDCHGLIVLGELLVIYGLNIFINKKFKVGTWFNILVSAAIAMVAGNIIM